MDVNKFEYIINFGGAIYKGTYTIDVIECGEINLNGISLQKVKAYGGTITRRQCTGKKDKNNVEIYNGDVILTKGVYLVVVYIDGAGMFSLNDRYIDDGCYIKTLCEDMYQEVVGNIHENPELLNG